MTDSQPLVCASLHLPPDIQPFLRIHQVAFEIFLPNLDRLRLTLETARDVCPSAAEIFYETRKITRNELEKVFRVSHSRQKLVGRYLKLLEAVSEGKPAQDPLEAVHLGAVGGVMRSKGAKQAFATFREELGRTVGRMTTVMSAKRKKSSKASFASPENIQLIFEIIGAVDECNALLQHCQDQFASLAKRTRDENSIESHPPSEEEIQVIHAKWQTLFDNIKGIPAHGYRIAGEILLPSRDNVEETSGKRKPGQNISIWHSLFQREAKRDTIHAANFPKLLGLSPDLATPPTSSHALQMNGVNQVSEVDATKGLGPSMKLDVSGTTTLNRPTSQSQKIPFWWKISLRTSPRDEVSEMLNARDGAPHLPSGEHRSATQHASHQNGFDTVQTVLNVCLINSHIALFESSEPEA